MSPIGEQPGMDNWCGRNFLLLHYIPAIFGSHPITQEVLGYTLSEGSFKFLPYAQARKAI
jgi:hypothetical protein